MSGIAVRDSSLQDLHRDLIALTQSQLRNIDRLWAKLDSHVNEFKQLLDKPPRNENSRKELFSGTHCIIAPLCLPDLC